MVNEMQGREIDRDTDRERVDVAFVFWNSRTDMNLKEFDKKKKVATGRIVDCFEIDFERAHHRSGAHELA